MRLYYAGDVHGSEKLWRKFVNAAAFYEAEVLVMGGDLTGKVLVPIVEHKPGVWVARLLGRERKAKGEDKLADLERRIRLNGFYPVRCGREEYERIEGDSQYRDRVFRITMRDELARWLNLAHDKLAGSGVRLFLMPGNDDEYDIDEVIAKAPEPIVPCDGKVLPLDGVQMLSSAWANPTPWNSPRELPEDRLFDKLVELAVGLEPEIPAIFNLHCPPFDSRLDMAPQVTDDLHVVTEGGEPKLVPVGSRAVRRLIEEYRPILGLHGHIHESRGAMTLGQTLCVNPGSLYAEGVLDGVVVDISDGRVVSHQLVSG
jgi:Icc-related predicted phosphoesterase